MDDIHGVSAAAYTDNDIAWLGPAFHLWSKHIVPRSVVGPRHHERRAVRQAERSQRSSCFEMDIFLHIIDDVTYAAAAAAIPHQKDPLAAPPGVKKRFNDRIDGIWIYLVKKRFEIADVGAYKFACIDSFDVKSP